MKSKIKNSAFVKTYFEKAADTYDRYAEFQNTVADALLGEVSGELVSAQNVLDIGCGTGSVHERLMSLGYKGEFYGVDLAFEMVRVSRAKAGAGRGKKYYIQADGRDLPFRDQDFDFVLSNLALHWGEPRDVFVEMYRVLKPGGSLWAALMAKNTFKELRHAVRTVLGVSAGDMSGLIPSFADEDTLRKIARAIPWKTFDIREKQYETHYRDLTVFLEHLKGTGTHVNALKAFSGLGGRGFIRKLEEAYRGLYPNDLGLPVTRNVFFITAVKGK